MDLRIQELREELHMTQVRLSVELGVSQETISAYEKGKHYPSVATLVQLSKLLHASCDYILGLTDIRQLQRDTPLDNKEQQLLLKYQQLNTHQQERLLAYLDGLLDQS